ncbi:electron transport complex subunit RsxC [Dysgonomonas sp. 216]|uniref:electron transport complex subunit RsxC n=1 Tax=Dysgonomonas sp. 216 TaxID=2302934 RepID=UPI0013D40A20|nr:electron transport complex subunit RsxC [Dysgonomonas sp. 216]NDW17515.1 electron transport complex subunit RsxC [Dysgonomonas sp. 216]
MITKIRTFRKGGIHPSENKISANKPIDTSNIPSLVVIPLSQHIGKPAIPVVNKGDIVKTGTLLAKADGLISANIHSSVSGTVLKIDEVMTISGFKHPAVYIEVDGDIWEDDIDTTDTLIKDCNLSSDEIKDKILEKGIVGMGGATFPLHVKLSPPPNSEAKYLLINAVECEPYLTCDHALMLEKSEEILVGTSILMKALNVEKAMIGIEANKPDAIKKLGKLSDNYKNIDIVPLKVRYPQGGEKQLVEACIGRQIPSGALPISVGAVVVNVATVFASYEAIQKNKPLIERVITVTGKHVEKPCNIRTRLGVPIGQLIEQAGGLPENTKKIIAGGPMMGKAISNIDMRATKGLSGLLIIPTLEAQRNEMKNCIRCGKCVNICCMGLTPYFLMNVSEFSDWDKAESAHITDCVECGSCSFVCPANRPILDYIRLGKNNVMKAKKARNN